MLGTALLVAAVVLVVLSALFSSAPAKPEDKAPAFKPGQPRFCLNCGNALKFGVVEGGKERHYCSCGFIHWNNPIPVAVVVIPSKDGVVLIKRKYPPAAGAWALPAGFVDAFESPEDAARREAKEETGLDVKIVRLLKVVMTPGKNNFLLFYLAERCDQQPVAGDDALEAGVYKLDNLPEMPFSTHREVLAECAKSGIC